VKSSRPQNAGTEAIRPGAGAVGAVERSDAATAKDRDQEDHDEDKEQDLGDRRGRAGNHAKAEYAGDESDHEKYNGGVKHGR
jgi:hypothetical protein